MLHSSTKPLLWGGLGAWRCLAADWELCGCAENKESGNTSCIKMQHSGLGDLSLDAGAETPWLLCPCTTAPKDRTYKGYVQTPLSGFNLRSDLPAVFLQCSSQNHLHTSPEHQEATARGEGWGEGRARSCHSLLDPCLLTIPPFPRGTRSSCQDWHIHPPPLRCKASISSSWGLLGKGHCSSLQPLCRAPGRSTSLVLHLNASQSACPGEKRLHLV